MWELLLSILWFPVDIMQRLSQRFVLLGRNIYSAFFGCQPAVKPSSPLVPRSSFSLHTPSPYKPDIQLDMTSNSRNAPPTKSEIKLTINPFVDYPINYTSGEIDVEKGIITPATDSDRMDSVCSVHSATPVIPCCADDSSLDAAEVQNVNVTQIDRNRNQLQKRLSTSEKRECGRHGRQVETTELTNNNNTRKNKREEGPKSKKQKLSAGDRAVTLKSVDVEETSQKSGVIDEEAKFKRKRKRSKKKKKESEDNTESNMGPQVFKPNYFVAIQICDENIISRIIELQQKMTTKTLAPPWHNLETTEMFKDAMIPVEKLHFTLHVMQIKREEDLEKANLALAECFQEIYQEFKDTPMDLEIEGLDHFRHSVIYAQIKGDEHVTRLKKLADMLRAKFEGLKISGDPRPFKPHLTVAKISRSNKLHKRKIRSFPLCFLEGHESTNFGTQRVRGLQLLSMMGEDPLTKYYNCVAQYNFGDIKTQLIDANIDKNSLDSTQNSETLTKVTENQSNSSTVV